MGFLHVLLLILKILGIALLCIIALLLLVTLLVLLVPIRYRLEGKRMTEECEPVYGFFKISWFGNAIRFKTDYDEHGLHIYFKILWLWLYDSWQDMDGKHNRVARWLLVKLGLLEDPKKKEAEAEIAKATETDFGTFPSEQTSASNTETVTNQTDSKASKKTTQKAKEDTSSTKQPEEPKETFFEKIKRTIDEKYQLLKRKYLETKRKILDIKKKVLMALDFLGKDFTKRFLKNLMKHVAKMIAHVLPRKWKGFVHFGINDNPELIGKILMYVGIFYPVYGKTVKVMPEYDRSFLDFDLVITGRIRLFYLLIQVLGIVLKKDTFQILDYFLKNR